MLYSNYTGSIAHAKTEALASKLLATFQGRTDRILTDPHRSTPIRTHEEFVSYFAKHASGEDRIGIYPVLEGRVKSATIDFDSHGKDDAFKERMQAKSLFCQQKLMEAGVSSYREISKSGFGNYHVWVLFDAWIDEGNVRWVLQSFCHHVLDCEPEIFPKESKGSIGYGCMLPYSGRYTDKGLTLFIDEVQKPMSFPESIVRNNAKVLEVLAAYYGLRRLELESFPLHRENFPSGSVVAASGNILSNGSDRISELLKGVSEGERNTACATLAGYYHKLDVPQDIVTENLRSWNRSNNPPMDDSEVNRVIESVFRYDNVGGMRTGASQIYARSDMGNAERFIDAFGDKLRYNHDSSEWYVWNGKYWEQDSKGKVVELAKEAVRRIYDEARNIDDPNQKRDLLKFALQSESNKSLKNMLTVAETSPKISITIKELDSEKVLLNLNNGTYDLKRDAFFEHSAEDNISKLAPVDYDAKSVCPQWLESLDLIFNCNQALIEYIQRAVGYSLSGDVSEQVLFFAHGTGKNGKSVFFETMKMLLGDFWQKAPTEMLMMKKNQSSGIPNDVARLQGARFVVASEVPEGGRLNEARIKDLTGGDTLVARFMHKEFFEFSPTHKLWIYGNYKPIVTGTNEGIWRRLQLIPFKVTIPDSRKREMSEILSIYKSELPGILNWAIEGWRKYRKDGLKPPDEVSAATSTYRSEMDVIGDFIRECCEEGKGQSILAVELYRAYRTWAENNGEMPVGGRRFIAAIQERGFERVKASGNQFVWLGIGLRGNQVPAPVPIDPSEPNPEETLDDPCADFPKD